MTDIQFYHLTSSPLDRALPKLLEKSLQGGFKVLVKMNNEDSVELMNQHLWSYDAGTFLPHGSEKDGPAAGQPIFLTTSMGNINNADLLIVTDGTTLQGETGYRRVLDIFDGNDPLITAAARERWKLYKESNQSLAYVKQNTSGGWQKMDIA